MSAFVLKLIKPVCSFLSYHPHNDGSGSRVAVTLSRTPAYEAPDASLPEAEFFWGGVSLSASAWDAAGEWLAVPYRGATYFVRSDALSSADSPDGSAYRGATLRRTPLYASPDASQPEADFLWGGVVVGGFTRWDAAGEWLAVAYGGGRYFARASDVSLNDCLCQAGNEQSGTRNLNSLADAPG